MERSLDGLILKVGNHETPEQDLCLLEAVAWFAGREHSDRPVCVSPVLGDYGRKLNDTLPDEPRQKLVPFIPRLVGTAGIRTADERRRWLARDWIIRTYTPAWLRLAGLTTEADALAHAVAISDETSLLATMKHLEAARDKADTAMAAARDTARDTASKRLQPTVEQLQQSAIDLYDRMIETVVTSTEVGA